MDYHIPISLDWNKEEVIAVALFFEGVERAFTSGIDKQEFIHLYRRFKEIVPSKNEEKQLFKQFDDETKLNCYKAVKEATINQKLETKRIKLGN